MKHMNTKEKMKEIFEINVSDVIRQRKKLIDELVDKVSDPTLPYAVVLYYLETIEVMGFAIMFDSHIKKQLKGKKIKEIRDLMDDASDDLPISFGEISDNMALWMMQRNEQDHYGLEEFVEEIRYYASKSIGEEKNTVAGLIHHLIFKERATVFSTMIEEVRYEMYLFAILVIGIAIWGEE